MSYLVILYHQNGKPVPMLDENNWTATLFDTEEEAEAAAERSSFGENFGWEVIEWGGK